MSWNSDTEGKLRKYWKLGYSGSKIAQLLGGDATRNSVLGKAFRLKLESRAISKKTTSRAHIEKDNSPEVKTQKLGRKSRFKALLLDPTFEKENPIQLKDLNDKLCRWPNNHPGDKDFYFCGRKARDGTVYCSLHFLYAFQSKNEKEEEKITEEDLPQFLEKKIKRA